MSLIKTLKVENFRSLRFLTMPDLGDYVPLVGLNSSGKSNILRALNLFFTNSIDETGTPVDLARDFSHLGAKGKKKTIAVTVTFDLSGGYRARDTLTQFLAAKGIGPDLVIRREWGYVSNVVQLTTSYGPTEGGLTVTGQADAAMVEAVLRSFGFRYIPNHIRPSDLISSVSDSLGQVLVSRWKKTKAYRAGRVELTMQALQKVADDLVGGLSENVSRPGTRIERVRADTPSGLGALAIQVALNVTSEGGAVEDPDLQGSGTQTFMLLHVLDLLATTQRELGFGWWPYSIWAMEEPESFLHAGLRTRYAEDLRRYSTDPNRQVILSTHQDEFLRVADEAFVVAAGAAGTTVTKKASRDAILEMSRQRVTTYPHPLFVFPDHPIVIVEGITDAIYLKKAIIEAGLRPAWKLISLEDIGLAKGGDDLRAWLKQNASVLAARPEGSPVFALRDWEERSSATWDAAMDKHPYSRCIVCNVTLANPELDDSFVGIERYLETGFVAANAGTRLKQAASGFGPYSILRADLAGIKPLLARQFAHGSPAGPHLVNLVRWIDQEIAGIVPATLAI